MCGLIRVDAQCTSVCKAPRLALCTRGAHAHVRTHRHTCALTQADLIERVLEMKFLPGHNPEITSIRLTIDPVYAAQRPLVYYAAISLLHALGAVGVGLLGFERQYVLGQTFLFRSAFADSQAPRTAPIIFCHGLGIGFLHYLRVLRQLPSSSDVYLLESPNITMSLGAETQRSIADTQALVRAMLHADGHSSACLVAHSFGTIVPSWLLTASDPSISSLVESVVLIDPISLLLYDPAVAYNFVHRTPATAVEIMMSYFVSQVSKQQTHAPARTSVQLLFCSEFLRAGLWRRGSRCTMQCCRRHWESMALTRATHFRSCTSRTPSRVTSHGHTPRCSSKTFLQTFMCRYCCPGPTPLSLPVLCVLTWSSTALCRFPGHQAGQDPRNRLRGAEYPGEIVS